MDEREFRRLLDLFPVVRSRNYCAESGSSSGSSSRPTDSNIADRDNSQKEADVKDVREIDIEVIPSQDGLTMFTHLKSLYKQENVFWQKLRVAAERKVGSMKAELFCKAFQKAHETLVNKELSLEAAQRFINAEGN